jgi:hypothetical protein
LILFKLLLIESWHAGCNGLNSQGAIENAPSSERPPMWRSFRMNRHRLAQLHISPLHLQQGLVASLALLITLIGGQQFLRWEQSQQEVKPPVPIHHMTQTHFSALSSQFSDSAPMHMMDVDQAQPVTDYVPQERLVF